MIASKILPLIRNIHTISSSAAWTPASPTTDGGYLPPLWLDGSDATTLFQDVLKTTPVVADGNPVRAWEDKSGNGNDALKAGGVDNTYETAQINGLSAVGFVFADNDYLQTAAFSSELAQANTIFIVAYTTNAVDINSVLDGIAAGKRHFLQYRSSGALRIDAGVVFTTATSVNFSAASLISVVYDGASSKIYHNGSLIETGNAGTNGLTGLTVGDNYLGSGTFGGYIGEILVYPAALSDADFTQVETYMATKWGVSLPP